MTMMDEQRCQEDAYSIAALVLNGRLGFGVK